MYHAFLTCVLSARFYALLLGATIMRNDDLPAWSPHRSPARSIPMIFCPACGTENDDDSKYCKKCGRALDDARQAKVAMTRPTGNRVADAEGRLIGDDGLPIGEDVDGVPGGERKIWSGRPSKLLSPIRAITRRYKLTNERLQIDSG